MSIVYLQTIMYYHYGYILMYPFVRHMITVYVENNGELLEGKRKKVLMVTRAQCYLQDKLDMVE